MKPSLSGSTRRTALFGVLGACLLSGCSWAPFHKVPLDAATGFYSDASLTYRLDAGQLQQPLDVIRVEGQLISYEQVASSPVPDQSIGTLKVTFPHPSGRPGYAEARFELDSGQHAAKPVAKKSWNPLKRSKNPPPASSLLSAHPTLHEAWSLDIPSAESDQLFKTVSNQGFYATERPGAIGTQLTVKINGNQVHKQWDQIAELNALVQRVRGQGQLVAYVRPTPTAGTASTAISSTKAYRDLWANAAPGGIPAGPASPMISAFSLAPPPASPAAPAAGVARAPGVSR